MGGRRAVYLVRMTTAALTPVCLICFRNALLLVQYRLWLICNVETSKTLGSYWLWHFNALKYNEAFEYINNSNIENAVNIIFHHYKLWFTEFCCQKNRANEENYFANFSLINFWCPWKLNEIKISGNGSLF